MQNDPTFEPTPAQTEIARAQQAQAALDNPLIAEALLAWETEITRTWADSPLRDAEGREALRRMLEASRQFKRFLTATMETGKLAQVKAQQDSVVRRLAQRVGFA